METLITDTVFRLANSRDFNEKNRLKIEELSNEFMVRSKTDDFTAKEIVRIFRDYATGEQSDPQFWLLWNQNSIIGYLITWYVVGNNDRGVQIWQGFAPNHSALCFETVENWAKLQGLDFVNVATQRNPLAYERWIKKYGYGYEYTAFRKELNRG